MSEASRERDQALRARAHRVVPGGLYGHLNAAFLPPGYPQYFREGRGCRIVDVDGNEYIDFMCSWGPIVLGHGHPRVETAVAAQQARGDCLNGPGEVFVELAELLVDTVAHADWCLLAKNGTDATTMCVTIARAATGKRKVLTARRAYHGADPWCTPSTSGVLPEDRAHIAHYQFNDVASLREAVDLAGDDLAAIMASAFKHDVFVDHELVDPEFAREARRLCDERGAVLIVDEVRAGLRMNLGGSWELVGVPPDLSAWSKALANGHPIAAVLGKDSLREAVTTIFTTGSFWFSAVPMAAAIATIRALREEDGIATMTASGERLRAGLAAQAAAHGFRIRQSGPPQMPLVLFEDDPNLEKGTAWTAAALRRGVYLHPYHTMFLSVAHRPEDVDQALDRTDAAFAELRRRFSPG